MTANHRPRKRFGQNFLHDRNVVERIVSAIRPRATDHLVEIGPGLGALTSGLLGRCARLDAVELDRDLAAHLEQEFVPRGLRLHQADALAFDFCALAEADEKLRVVGNLPYNISTPLIFHLLDQAECVSDMHFMLQREVVQRLAAAPGGRDYGRLSVMAQYRCRVEKLIDVPPGAFRPAPKVQSAVVRLTPYLRPGADVRERQALSRVVAAAFSQRRKTLRNALRPLLSADVIESLGIDPTRRAETVTLDEYVRLANAGEALEGPASAD